MSQKAILIANLGSPAAPTPEALKPYLNEFLMDPFVIDTPYLLRAFLVKGIIIPRRSKASAEAYQKIWTPQGSPLVTYTQDLAQGVQKLLPNVPVRWAMRYGQPSLESVLEQLKNEGFQKLLFVPLYPQYALASTESTVQKVQELNLKKQWNFDFEHFHSFYKEEFYLDASAKIYQKFLEARPAYNHYLFSYHGLPERHVKKLDPSGEHCLMKNNCCDVETPNNRFCYRHQCVVNTREIAKRLGLKDGSWSLSFQSRLGRDPWLKPFTDVEIPLLAKSGVKRLAVFSPAFVADCLETLEEIAMRGSESFVEAGGETLDLVPSLNADPIWIDALGGRLQEFFKEI